MDAATFRQAMRHHAGTVAVIAVGRADERAGLTATSVCSLSDDPPTILACVNRSAGAHPRIRAERCFSVNILSVDQQELASCFAGRKGLAGAARFSRGTWTTLTTGAPVLADAVASFDCELVCEHECKTHSIFIGLVREIRIEPVRDPLLYLRGRFSAVQPLLGEDAAD